MAYFYTIDDAKDFYKNYRFKNGFLPHFDKVTDVIELIHKYNGLDIVPHPFGRKGVFRRLRHRGLDVHAVEVVNAFTGERRNQKAKRHVSGNNKFLKLAAADMHFFISDIHKVYTELSSEREMDKREIWENLQGKRRTIIFSPVGNQFNEFKIWFQKPLCAVVYTLNYPRLYLAYRFGKLRHGK